VPGEAVAGICQSCAAGVGARNLQPLAAVRARPARYSPRAFVSRTSVENDTALEVVFAITDSRQRREVSRPFRERLRISLI
jgi:hypothetical protein